MAPGKLAADYPVAESRFADGTVVARITTASVYAFVVEMEQAAAEWQRQGNVEVAEDCRDLAAEAREALAADDREALIELLDCGLTPDVIDDNVDALVPDFRPVRIASRIATRITPMRMMGTRQIRRPRTRERRASRRARAPGRRSDEDPSEHDLARRAVA